MGGKSWDWDWDWDWKSADEDFGLVVVGLRRTQPILFVLNNDGYEIERQVSTEHNTLFRFDPDPNTYPSYHPCLYTPDPWPAARELLSEIVRNDEMKSQQSERNRSFESPSRKERACPRVALTLTLTLTWCPSHHPRILLLWRVASPLSVTTSKPIPRHHPLPALRALHPCSVLTFGRSALASVPKQHRNVALDQDPLGPFAARARGSPRVVHRQDEGRGALQLPFLLPSFLRPPPSALHSFLLLSLPRTVRTSKL